MLDKIWTLLKRDFWAGFLITVPVTAAIYVFVSVVTWLLTRFDFVNIFTGKFSSDTLPGFIVDAINSILAAADIGLSIIISLAVILAVGALARNYAGRKILAWGEARIERVPFLRTVYNAIKQLTDAIFARGGKSNFTRVVLIQYPREGLYSLAFVTSDTVKEITRAVNREMINVFVPTTPNPTSGFFIAVPKEDATPLDLTPEEAFRLIISGGIAAPDDEDSAEVPLADSSAD